MIHEGILLPDPTDRSLLDPLMQCVLGPALKPPVDPTWLTSIVVSLATGIQSDEAFDRLPILADALEDAGCDNSELLTHLRSDDTHVKGCWALDLVLGKS